MEYVILGRHQDGNTTEILEQCNYDDVHYLVNEYQISFGLQWDIWYEEDILK